MLAVSTKTLSPFSILAHFIHDHAFLHELQQKTANLRRINVACREGFFPLAEDALGQSHQFSNSRLGKFGCLVSPLLHCCLDTGAVTTQSFGKYLHVPVCPPTNILRVLETNPLRPPLEGSTTFLDPFLISRRN